MSVTGARGTVAARNPGRLESGAVLVADELVRPGGAAVECRAAALLAGTLRRQGAATVRGPLHLDADADAGEAGALAAVLPASGGGLTGLGAAAADGDRAGRTAVRAALAAWLSVAGPREVVLAAPRSFCAGVERAIEIVEYALEQRAGPVHVRKQIVHNTHVVADLEARGAVFVDELDEVPDGATVVFSAHGVSPAVHAEAERRGLEVIDATCPLVTKVHAEARRFAARGDTVVLIGHAGHEEVEGTLGEAPDRTVLVETPADVEGLRVGDPERVSYLTQTTLAVDETAEVVDALRARFPAVRGPASDDICYATTNRQDALKAIAEEADLVLVVGSANSSNSVRLAELARRSGAPGHLVDDVGGIRPEWLAGARRIGLTAGASAPPHLVGAVVAALSGLGPVTVTEHETARETIRFTLPPAVRPSS
ncbi:4-hydroxy-3-methylbut-2-enyl diphosphate reductase [Spinactinospora alkalitolerans]|uniref:4-hydroxy-3-methylbut-2-enyl diphosphate reductase n=1 Tax=Spinactinospora alkalitolerans TaxID=687207 RepID=A0A852U8A9_9ACTN|nr:4-hydroxy-3-methylbut-2-enyl diphosphate reductase [Spinactinospora alkalitolerans]NYE50160.1 4-hydroxy-3-methylbut-2-enyl diphosphate reductase [Spinactinospora alkalitolerans]